MHFTLASAIVLSRRTACERQCEALRKAARFETKPEIRIRTQNENILFVWGLGGIGGIFSYFFSGTRGGLVGGRSIRSLETFRKGNGDRNISINMWHTTKTKNGKQGRQHNQDDPVCPIRCYAYMGFNN